MERTVSGAKSLISNGAEAERPIHPEIPSETWSMRSFARRNADHTGNVLICEGARRVKAVAMLSNAANPASQTPAQTPFRWNHLNEDNLR